MNCHLNWLFGISSTNRRIMTLISLSSPSTSSTTTYRVGVEGGGGGCRCLDASRGVRDSRYIPRKWTWNPQRWRSFLKGWFLGSRGEKCFLEEMKCSPQELNDFNLKDHHTSRRWSHDERCLVSFLLIKFAKCLHYGTHLHHRLKYEIDFFVNLLITK